MSQFRDNDGDLQWFPPALICVIDTSVLIRFKRLVKADSQFEMGEAKYPDAPGVWIAGDVRKCVRYPSPSDAALVQVLTVAEQLVEADDTNPDGVADPYVAAMACDLRSTYQQCRVVVATEDVVDRLPRKLSLATACSRLALEYWRAEAFVEWVRGAPNAPAPELLDPPDWAG